VLFGRKRNGDFYKKEGEAHEHEKYLRSPNAPTETIDPTRHNPDPSFHGQSADGSFHQGKPENKRGRYGLPGFKQMMKDSHKKIKGDTEGKAEQKTINQQQEEKEWNEKEKTNLLKDATRREIDGKKVLLKKLEDGKITHKQYEQDLKVQGLTKDQAIPKKEGISKDEEKQLRKVNGHIAVATRQLEDLKMKKQNGVKDHSNKEFYSKTDETVAQHLEKFIADKKYESIKISGKVEGGFSGIGNQHGNEDDHGNTVDKTTYNKRANSAKAQKEGKYGEAVPTFSGQYQEKRKVYDEFEGVNKFTSKLSDTVKKQQDIIREHGDNTKFSKSGHPNGVVDKSIPGRSQDPYRDYTSYEDPVQRVEDSTEGSNAELAALMGGQGQRH
jgi:hypothetical protein